MLKHLFNHFYWTVRGGWKGAVQRGCETHAKHTTIPLAHKRYYKGPTTTLTPLLFSKSASYRTVTVEVLSDGPCSCYGPFPRNTRESNHLQKDPEFWSDWRFGLAISRPRGWSSTNWASGLQGSASVFYRVFFYLRFLVHPQMGMAFQRRQTSSAPRHHKWSQHTRLLSVIFLTWKQR